MPLVTDIEEEDPLEAYMSTLTEGRVEQKEAHDSIQNSIKQKIQQKHQDPLPEEPLAEDAMETEEVMDENKVFTLEDLEQLNQNPSNNNDNL